MGISDSFLRSSLSLLDMICDELSGDNPFKDDAIFWLGVACIFDDWFEPEIDPDDDPVEAPEERADDDVLEAVDDEVEDDAELVGEPPTGIVVTAPEMTVTDVFCNCDWARRSVI